MPDKPDPQPVVFVVDDDAGVRDAFWLLRSVGLRVSTFGSAADFLASQMPEGRVASSSTSACPVLSGLDFQAELTRADSVCRSSSSPAMAISR